MSARSGSHGGLRRSVSLTRTSRPSVGVSQHGAQRVSGAAFDSRSSGGYSMLLLFYQIRNLLQLLISIVITGVDAVSDACLLSNCQNGSLGLERY